MAFGSPQWMYSSGEDFTLDQSLRLNDDSSGLSHNAKLKRTPGSTTNQKTFTFSAWVKRGTHTQGADQNHTLICAAYGDYGQGSRYSHICFNDEDRLQIFSGIYQTTTTTWSFRKRTKAVYRDSSAWYHIVWRHDSTDGTSANRDRLYVNGVLQEWDTSWSHDTTTGLNHDSFFNITTSPVTLGCYNRSGRSPYTDEMFFDGYMAEVHFIDGTSVAATSFGEGGDYGEWKPIKVSGLTYGNNGFYLSFVGGGVMSATGGTITTDGDYKVHSFTADGTFTPTSVPATNSYVEYLVIAGGGSGGRSLGGGGAGGYRTGMLSITTQAYSITVGDGGAPSTGQGDDGDNSVFSTITSIGGGGGGKAYSNNGDGRDGGSGGGGASTDGSSSDGGSGTAGQGYAGGNATNSSGTRWNGGGGGGAGAGASNASTAGTATAGGAGLTSSITGSSVTRAGGGGGGAYYYSTTGTSGAGGSGGGGTGGKNGVNPTAGTANTGSGGGGNGLTNAGHTQGSTSGAGGSGIVIIRYKFQ